MKTEQKLRDQVLRLCLEFRLLVQHETLADSMTHDTADRKALSDACAIKLADLLSLFDEIVGGFHHDEL